MSADRCKDVLSRICAEVGKREGSPFCKQVAKHLESCADCRAQAESLRGTLELYWCLEREEVPADVASKLREALGLGGDQDRPSKS